MRALLVTVLLVAASGCHKNHDELRRRQAELDVRLSSLQAQADNLIEERKALDALDLEVRNGLAELPGAKEQLAAIEAEPLAIAPLPSLPPLPDDSLFEGSEGPRMRARISDTEHRIAQLGKILGELGHMAAEKRKLQRQVEALRRLKAQQKSPPATNSGLPCSSPRRNTPMVRHLVMAALLFGTVASAQNLKNRAERARDRQDLRQDRRQLATDRLDAARAAQLLSDYDAAAAANDVARLGGLDVAFNQHLTRELAESKIESAQARQELREDRRELRSDRRELRQDVALGRRPGVVADDARDQARDRGNLADDRRDAVKERVSRERLLGIQAQLAGLAGRFDRPAISQKRALYGEVLGLAVNELSGDQQESREDRRELREDRRETREDRRDPLR